MVQLPVPKSINCKNILKSLKPSKDVDCLEPSNYAKFLMNLEKSEIMPCTAQAALHILDEYKINVEGLNTVIIGNKFIIMVISLMITNRG